MKAKEYVKKYDLNNSKDLDTQKFADDFFADFSVNIKNMTQSRDITMSGFHACVAMLYDKFKGIQNRSEHPAVTEKLWKFIYATKIGPLKDVLVAIESGTEEDFREAMIRAPMWLSNHMAMNGLFKAAEAPLTKRK